MAFDTAVEQPLLLLLNYLRSLGAPHALCELSVALANDSVLSAACMQQPARLTAAAALGVAATLLEQV